METKPSSPDPKNAVEAYVLALLQEMSAMLDGMEQEISSIPIISQVMVTHRSRLDWTHQPINRVPVVFEKLLGWVDYSKRPV